jgi:hypothetical protein
MEDNTKISASYQPFMCILFAVIFCVFWRDFLLKVHYYIGASHIVLIALMQQKGPLGQGSQLRIKPGTCFVIFTA